jgi:hypothetical protein
VKTKTRLVLAAFSFTLFPFYSRCALVVTARCAKGSAVFLPLLLLLVCVYGLRPTIDVSLCSHQIKLLQMRMGAR